MAKQSKDNQGWGRRLGKYCIQSKNIKEYNHVISEIWTISKRTNLKIYNVKESAEIQLKE